MLASSILIESSSKLLVIRTGIKDGTSLISGWIRLLTSELLALERRKFYTFKLEYLWGQLASLDRFMYSITGGGERLHKVLRQIGLKLWCPWQQKAHIDLQWGKWCRHLFSFVFDPILFILAGNEDMHKISDEFEFRPDRTTDYGVSCPWGLKNFPYTYNEKVVPPC